MHATSTPHVASAQVHRPIGSFVFQGFELRILMTSVQTAGLFSMIEGAIPPGGDSGLHVQHHEDERLVVLSGSLEVTLGTKTQDLHEGDSYVVPRGQPHRIRNVGPQEARAIVVTSPGGFDEFVRLAGTPIDQIQAAAAPTQEGVTRLLALAQRFGIEMLPDPVR